MTYTSTRQIRPATGFDVSIELPGSKSITNRALLLAALGGAPSIISRPLRSLDTVAFAEALNAMGAVVRWRDGDIRVEAPLSEGIQDRKAHCQDAGTAARFLPPAAAALGADVYFDASNQLRARPLAQLLEALRAQGALTEPATADRLPFRIRGAGLAGGEVALSGEVSSQFLSGLLMAAPLARRPLAIRCDNLVSRPYVDLTLAMMEEFGKLVGREEYGWFGVEDLGRYQMPSTYPVEADASTASYFFAAAAVAGGRLRVPNIRRSSRQGDIRFLEILEQMGAAVAEAEGGGVVVEGGSRLRGVEVDMSDISDVLMTLACIAPFAATPTHIRNVAHARRKESDRVAAVESELARLGVRCEAGPGSLTIYPGRPHGGLVHTFEDHRIAMAFSVLGLAVPGIEIENPACVEKTCPTFFDLWSRIEGPSNLFPGEP